MQKNTIPNVKVNGKIWNLRQNRPEDSEFNIEETICWNHIEKRTFSKLQWPNYFKSDMGLKSKEREA